MRSCLRHRALKLKPHAAVLKIMMTATATYLAFREGPGDVLARFAAAQHKDTIFFWCLRRRSATRLHFLFRSVFHSSPI